MADKTRRKIKILLAASEAVPFVKTGGLADVAGSLPKAEMKPVCEALRARLGDDVALEARGGFLGDSGAIAAAGRADAVVLVERLHESRTADIAREIDVMNIGGAKVGGFLLA